MLDLSCIRRKESVAVLSDKTIRNLCDPRYEKPLIHPMSEKEYSKLSYGLSSHGYDFRLAAETAGDPDSGVWIYQAGKTLDPICPPKHISEVARKLDCLTDTETGLDYYELPPYSVSLAVTHEYFVLPKNVVGFVYTKSTYARCGIHFNTTSLEAGWEGHITIEVTNNSPRCVRIYPMLGFGQVHFIRGDEAEQVYSGKYQGQGKTATLYKPG
jgi:dCTP deaminase